MRAVKRWISPLSRSILEHRSAPASGVGRRLSLAAAAFSVASTLALAQEIQLHVSSNAGDRLTPKPPVRFEKLGAPAGRAFRIDEAVTRQTIVGFGASFLEAGMICLNSLPEAERTKVLRACFDPVDGAGFTAMKTPLAGTDFMSAGPWYTYDDHPGDVAMKQFSIARDLGTNGLIPYIKLARRHGNFVLQAPLDYPPDWMLIDVKKNQDVDPKYFDALALYYLRYLREYEKQGVFIDYLSLFNEPGIYTKIPWRKIRDLIKNHVGPLLRRENIKTKLMLSEAVGHVPAFRGYPVVLDDPDARKYIAAVPYHGYETQNLGLIARLHQRYPDLPVWMTEICHAYEAGTPKRMHLPRTDFADGDYWGRRIIGDLEAGAAAWIYWNMILDENGGPWLVSEIHGNPDPNIQHPVVIIDRRTQRVIYTGLYYYLTHFSKFVRPGAVRLGVTGSQRGVRCVGFKTPDQKLVAQFLNSRKDPTEVRIAWRDRSVRLTLPAISITTALWESKQD